MAFIVVVVIAALFIWIALKNIRWATFVVAALLPTYLVRFSIGPFPSTLLEVFIVITILVWGIKYSREPRTPNPEPSRVVERFRPWRWPIALFFVAGIVSIVVAPDPWKALGLFRAYLLEPILFFVVCISVLRGERDLRRLAAAVGVSALVISAYAVIQRLTGLGIPTPWDVEHRVTGFYAFPNAVGLFLGPLIPLFVALAIKKMITQNSPFDAAQGRKLRTQLGRLAFWIMSTTLSVLAIIFSKTEAAWVGVLVGLLFLGLTHRRARVPTLIAALLALGLVVSVPQTRTPLIEKLTLQDWSGQVRRTQWRETLAMLRDRPIFGAGLSGYPETVLPYHKATYIEIFQYPHNIILNFWSELGLLGVVAFGWILVTFFNFIRRFVTSSLVRNERLLALGLAAGVLSLLVHGAVDVPYFKNDLAVQFWLFIAAATVITSLPKQKEVIG